MEQVGWDEFFKVFDASGAAFLHLDKTKSGKRSRFNRFVEAGADDDAATSPPSSAKSAQSSADPPRKAATRTPSAKSKAEASKTTQASAAGAKAASAKLAGKNPRQTRASAAPQASTRRDTAGRSGGTTKADQKPTATRSAPRPASKAPGQRKSPESPSGRAKSSAPAPAKVSAKPARSANAKAGAAAAATDAVTTTDHDRIREWAEVRGGRPCHVTRTGDQDDLGLLRIDFQEPDEGLEEVSWDAFLSTFEDKNLAFVYKERTKGGNVSRFCKFVSRQSS